MQIFLYKAGKQSGPFTLEQFQAGVRAGAVGLSDLAWHEGLVGWTLVSAFLGGSFDDVPPQSHSSAESELVSSEDDMDGLVDALREAHDSGELVREDDVVLVRNASSLISKAISTTFVGGSRLRVMCDELVNRVAEGNRRCEIESDYEVAIIGILAGSYIKILSTAIADDWFLHLVLKSVRSENFGSSISNSVVATLSNALCDAAERATLQLDYSPANTNDSRLGNDWDEE